MATRIRIGLLFSYDESWIGGTYYILNLIHALNTLNEDKKPHLVILSEKTKDFEIVKAIGYPFIEFKQYKFKDNSLLVRGINKLSRIIIKEEIIKGKAFDGKLDLLFPSVNNNFFRTIPKQLFWIPDFQEAHLPQFFRLDEIKYRKQQQRYLVSNDKSILFSSRSAFNDFNRLYPEAKGNYHVLNFAVTHPSYQNLDINELRKKYNLELPYFFSPNQFWKHKNHRLVLESLKILKEKGALNFKVAFSGKETDRRNPNYFQELKEYVQQHELNGHVLFLGFIDRREQLQLMNHAIAIIQPSLFEGWSTTVEDAKVMNQNVIVSDLEVHKEQLVDRGYYFKRDCENSLAELLLYFRENKFKRPSYEYQDKIRKFGTEFIEIAKNLN